MGILKKVVIATVVVVALGVGVVFGLDHFAAGFSEAVDQAYQEQRFEDMFERDRLEKIRCSKMSKKQRLSEMCP